MALPEDSTITHWSRRPTEDLNARLRDTAHFNHQRLAYSRSLHDVINCLTWRMVRLVMDAWPKLRFTAIASGGLAFALLLGGLSASSDVSDWLICLLACLLTLAALVPVAAYQLAVQEVIAGQGGPSSYLMVVGQNTASNQPSGRLHRQLDSTVSLFISRWPRDWKALRRGLLAATGLCLVLAWGTAYSPGQRFMELASVLLLIQLVLRAAYVLCLSEVARYLLRLSE